MAVEYNFTLDMDRSKRDNNIVYARTGDLDSIVINADLVFDGAPYTPTGENAFFECVTPNGCSVRSAAEKSGSSVSVEVPSAAFQAAGVINVAYFRFETGETASPTYVESTEPFAIVVREGIGDNIDTGDYIEGWRLLADQIEALKEEVEQKAQQAETAINEQKEEVDQLKTQAQTAIAGDVVKVEEAAQSAVTAINKEKADVADAAEGITEAGEQAINQFNTNSQQAINQFDSDGASAISQFNTNSQQAISSFNTDGASAIGKFNSDGTSAVDQFNSKSTSAIDQFNTDAGDKLEEVDGMITEAQGDVNAAITQLETATNQAVDAMEDALDGTTAGSLQNAINRTLKLDVADMTVIPDNASLSSFTNVGSYCCKTAATAATVGDCPVDDSPFNMYVFSSATSGQVMQLVVPIYLNGKPTAEWHVRFGTSSAMDPWSVIGGGADIAAGLGIDVTGDAQKTVALDTDAFYQHYGAASIIQGSTEVTGGGRVKELRVKGKTWVNRWPQFPTTTTNGITLTCDETGLFKLTGTATARTTFRQAVSGIAASKIVGAIASKSISNAIIDFYAYADGSFASVVIGTIGNIFKSAAVPASGWDTLYAYIIVESGQIVNDSFRCMLVDGTEAPDCFTPCASITSVQPGNLVTAGKNLLESSTFTSGPNNNGEINFSLPAGTYTLSCYNAEDWWTGNANGTKWYIQDADNIDVVSVIIGSPSVGSRSSGTFTLSRAGAFKLYTYKPGIAEMATDLQLELGSTATAYEPPNVTQTALPEVELRSLPNGTCDELVIKADGTCEVERNVSEYEVQGTETLNVGEHSNGQKYASISGVASNASNSSSSLLSDRYACGAYDTIDKYAYIQNARDLLINDSRFTDVDAAKSILAIEKTKFVFEVTQTEEPQSPVTLPALPAPTFNQYHDADIPTEIEAEVVKVDYLPAPDVYTREEVDQKIEDAGGMPDIVPVSQGGTGVTTAAAERNRLGLGNTTGALPVANGGTGATTAKAAEYNIIGGMITDSSDPTDNSNFAMVRGDLSSANGVLFKLKGTNIWNWIDSKIRSTFGFNSSNVLPVANGGTGSNTPEGAREAIGAGTSNFSGSYNDLADKPQIPSVPVSVANGGTGGTSAKAAQNSLLNDMNLSSDPLTDSSMLVGYNASPSDSDGAVHKRSVTTIWDYVADKIRGTFGFNSSNVLDVEHGGTGFNDFPAMLVDLGSASTASPYQIAPRPGVTGTLPVSNGGTGATAPGVDMLNNLGITFGTADPPSTGTPGSIYIQYFE